MNRSIIGLCGLMAVEAMAEVTPDKVDSELINDASPIIVPVEESDASIFDNNEFQSDSPSFTDVLAEGKPVSFEEGGYLQDLEKQEPAEEERKYAYEYGSISVSLPIHAPNLEIPAYGIDVDVVDLAKQAYMWFGVGIRHDFSLFGQNMWFDVNGWYGAYDFSPPLEIGGSIGKELDGGIELSNEQRQDVMKYLNNGDDTGWRVIPKNIGLEGTLTAGGYVQADLLADMEQQVISAEIGMYLLEDWHGLSVGAVVGMRDYQQTMTFSGNIMAGGAINYTGDIHMSGGACAILGLAGHSCTGINAGISDSVSLPIDMVIETNSTTATAGLTVDYRWSQRNEIQAYASWGSNNSLRYQITNEYRFDNDVFVNVGVRRDEFEADGNLLIEQGALLEFGKTF